MSWQKIIDFWFQELSTSQWWKKDPELDREIERRFQNTLVQAAKGELWEWRETSLGRLAEVIVLDQFPRNIYRGQAKSFEFDSLALVLAQEAVSLKCDQDLTVSQKSFLYLPFMHSESKVVHEKAVELYSIEGLEGNLDFEFKHKVIIDRFGRYPHRNEILGRVSTQEELAFLQEPNSSF